MPILLQCSGCGKEYRVSEKMAGKQATCRCGATMRVPSRSSEGESEESLDDWVADAFRAPASAAPAVEPEPPAAETPAPSQPPIASAIVPPEPRRRRKWKPDRRYKLVGVASIVYGSIAAVVMFLTGALGPPLGIFGLCRWIASVVFAAAVAWGGVLILKRHEHGPACAGLACIFLCFLSAWFMLWKLPVALIFGGVAVFAILVAFLLVAYSVPVCIVVWCLREEMERQRLEAEEP